MAEHFYQLSSEQLATWKTSAPSISVPASKSGECQQSCTCLIICCCTVVTTDQMVELIECKLLSDEGTNASYCQTKGPACVENGLEVCA